MATKSLKQMIADWRRARAGMGKLMGNLPRIIGNECVAVVRDNFRLQGYDDGQGLQRWPGRKDSTDKRYDKRTNKSGVKGSVIGSHNKILIQTGNLRDSVKYQVSGRMVRIGVDLKTIPYAQIHNEGLTGKAWGKHPFRMPKRKYMPTEGEGPNQKMLVQIKRKVDHETDQAMKDFKR